jgi:hypothetical protein
MRPLYEIAGEIEADCIRKDWYLYAEPYVSAMKNLTVISDRYYEDSGSSVVAYALANLSSWRGDKARAIKAELKGLLK